MNNMLRVLALGVAILLPARADPPVLVIDSWPVAATCKPTVPGEETANGAAPLRSTPFSASAGDCTRPQ
jgi:hypothetical protein